MKKYETPVCDVIRLDASDIITSSGCTEMAEMPSYCLTPADEEY